MTTVERVDAVDQSGDFVLVLRDGENIVEIQEYNEEGQLLRRSYGDALGAQ